MKTTAHIGELEDKLMLLAKRAGSLRGIDIGYAQEPTSAKGDYWEFRVADWKVDRRDGAFPVYSCRVELSYWVSSYGCRDQKLSLTVSIPLDSAAESVIIAEVLKMIDDIASTGD